MSDKDSIKLPFDSEDPAEQKLWSMLEELPREAPSVDMRRGFYKQLDKASEPTGFARLMRWLGMSGNSGWITASACVLIGFAVGQAMTDAAPDGAPRLAALEQNVAMLNRELILDRLQDGAPSTRLRGAVDAASLVQGDAEIARALLTRATEDNVFSVRTAAIDALAPSLSTSAVGSELMKLLEHAESPLVQLALVDLVLRNGTEAQLQQLIQLAHEERLHPDLIRHVERSLGSEST